MIASTPGVTGDADFPERRFQPQQKWLAAYRESVACGWSRMAGSRIVFCGLARNVGDLLPATIARIERLAESFADYRVLIYENDSDDSTPAQLAQWAATNRRVVVISETRRRPRHDSIRSLTRAADMADYRARCQEQVARRWADFDYASVVDTDLAGGWSYDGVAHTLGSDSWDFVGSYGIIYQRHKLTLNRPLHYDVWAFRRSGSYAPIEGIAGNLLAWSRGEPLLPVHSCFGGLGLYRMPAWLAGSYGGGDCEHVVLHRRMREAGFGRQYLNPSQIVLYGRKRKRFDGLLQSIDRFAQRVAAVAISA
jgi:hypothetical protein